MTTTSEHRLSPTACRSRHHHQHEQARYPFDNAKAESFMKTLKAEEVDGKAFLSISTTLVAASTASSRRSTTKSACTRRSDTSRPSSSKPPSRKTSTVTRRDNPTVTAITVSHLRGAMQCTQCTRTDRSAAKLLN